MKAPVKMAGNKKIIHVFPSLLRKGREDQPVVAERVMWCARAVDPGGVGEGGTTTNRLDKAWLFMQSLLVGAAGAFRCGASDQLFTALLACTQTRPSCLSQALVQALLIKSANIAALSGVNIEWGP